MEETQQPLSSAKINPSTFSYLRVQPSSPVPALTGPPAEGQNSEVSALPLKQSMSVASNPTSMNFERQHMEKTPFDSNEDKSQYPSKTANMQPPPFAYLQGLKQMSMGGASMGPADKSGEEDSFGMEPALDFPFFPRTSPWDESDETDMTAPKAGRPMPPPSYPEMF